ncbi:hypothetical protein COX05_02590 [candidate division WWE3 bacterium CG22_combo_CG10-13_8_21_14_all_39_12]|uniref:Uncharacterized protein n=1 Tax=candidate division WWE3 bacterium CG22_combo_CG10-13_8_21_14_all_39_12 TaxID=1975094 RepID=A0A2H0BFS1_UNCKA|nr:MAG: hypothetical protein COX05_02590 [candidate division WWE3 bacterium CG22_combo_CG10-13_8_21_14_all_39_12]
MNINNQKERGNYRIKKKLFLDRLVPFFNNNKHLQKGGVHVTRQMQNVLFYVLLAIGWSLAVLIVSDLMWFNPTVAILIGVAVIIVLGIGNLTRRDFNVISGAGNSVQWMFSFLWLNKWLTLLLVGVLMILIGGLTDFGWWLDDFTYKLSSMLGTFIEWISWNPLVNVILVGIIVGGILYLRRPVGRFGPALAGFGLTVAFNKFNQFETKSKLTILGLVLTMIVLAILKQTIDFWIVTSVFALVLYRQWPRKNPFNPPPIEEFSLPVVRILALPMLIPAFLGVCFFLFCGILGAYILGDTYPVIVGVVAAQIFFLIWVDKVPGTTTAWTQLKIYPAENMMIFDRSRGGAGEMSLIKLKLGSTRFKERKGIIDNLMRFLGWHLLEAEPLGVKKEKGEQENFEVWVNTNGWKFSFNGREITGASAYITWLATERE